LDDPAILLKKNTAYTAVFLLQFLSRQSLINKILALCHAERSEESLKPLVFKEIPQPLRFLGMTKNYNCFSAALTF